MIQMLVPLYLGEKYILIEKHKKAFYKEEKESKPGISNDILCSKRLGQWPCEKRPFLCTEKGEQWPQERTACPAAVGVPSQMPSASFPDPTLWYMRHIVG